MSAPVRRTRSNRRSTALAVSVALALLAVLVAPGSAGAADAPVGLGVATTFAVLGAETVTNDGATVIVGDVGVSPGSSVTGFPPAVVTGGTIHVSDGPANQAQADAGVAYLDAAGRTPRTDVVADLGGQTLVPGVYGTDSSLGITGTLTLDGQDDPDAVFVFQAGSTLITASDSHIVLINGANPCNITWQVGSSATLGTDSTFVGTILALTSVSATTGAAIDGRLIARGGAVTLDSNVVTVPVCAAVPPGTTTSTVPGSSSTVPGSSSTVPGSSSTVPGSSSTVPGSSSTVPGSTTNPETSTTSTSTTTTVPTSTSGSGSTPGGTTSTLARTGSDPTRPVLAGILAVLLGLVLVIGARRRLAGS